MDSCSQFIIGYIRSNEAGALFAFRRRRGCVLPLCLSSFPLPSGFGQILGQGLGFHLNTLFVQALDNLLCVEAALLHSLQRRGQSEDGFLHGHGSIPVQRDRSGFECRKLLSDFLQLRDGDGHEASSSVSPGPCPGLMICLSGRAGRSPTLHASEA